jgi:hypothetical protein
MVTKKEKRRAFLRELEIAKEITEAQRGWARGTRNTHVNPQIEEARKSGGRIPPHQTLSQMDGDWS